MSCIKPNQTTVDTKSKSCGSGYTGGTKHVQGGLANRNCAHAQVLAMLMEMRSNRAAFLLSKPSVFMQKAVKQRAKYAVI